MKKHLEVAAAFVQRVDGKVLLCKRMPGDNYGRLWEFPGGKIETGETPQQAIVRELKEEIDINAEAAEELFCVEDENENLHINAHLIRIKRFTGNIVCRECEDYVFVTLEKAKSFDLAPADIKMLNLLIEKFPKNKLEHL